jgi:tRNA A-37 threonylcarbamoyl transferase component Bud32
MCPADGTSLVDAGSLLNWTIAGKYVLIEELGSGGWGTVYLARHTELGSRVAVKFLLPELSNNMKHIERFKQESQALARLEHPGVVRVIDRGLSPRPYIVMEYAQGRLLSELIAEKGALGEALVYSIARRLAETLNYAHSLGVIHCDLKPQNIIIHDFDFEHPELIDLKLLDFGVSRLLDQQALMEGTGESFGSPPYMSPELFGGDCDVGPKADIYSAGCVLFECLTGRKPFTAQTYIQWSAVHRHVRAAFPEGSENLGKRKELARLILQCLSKAPDARPSAEALLLALKNITMAKAVPSTANPFTELVKSHPRLLIGVVAALATVVLGTTMVVQIQDKERARAAAARKLLELGDETKADLITTMSAGQVLQKVETRNSRLQLKKGLAPVDLEIYKPASAQAMVVVLAAAGDAKLLAPLFNFWAERGYLVAVAQFAHKQASPEAGAEIVKAAVSQLSASAALPVARIALVPVSMDLDQALSTARAYRPADENSTDEVGGVILINPLVKSKTAASPKTYHDCQFPVFFVLDADLNSKTRPAAGRRCQTAFTFGSGRQILFNSTRVSLSAKPSYDQKLLQSLLTGFLKASLEHDRAKESYLYSQKSMTAVSSVAELRFR